MKKIKEVHQELTVGDKLKRRMKIYDADRTSGKPEEMTVDATVVYIHPEQRYYTLRFDLGPGRSFRESFQII